MRLVDAIFDSSCLNYKAQQCFLAACSQ